MRERGGEREREKEREREREREMRERERERRRERGEMTKTPVFTVTHPLRLLGVNKYRIRVKSFFVFLYSPFIPPNITPKGHCIELIWYDHTD